MSPAQAHRFELAEARCGAAGATASAEIGGGLAIFAGVDSPITQAFGLGFIGAVGADDLDALERFFFSRGSSSAIEVAAAADPSLERQLEARGYAAIERSRVLVRPVPATSEAVPAEIEICEAAPRPWAEVMAEAFDAENLVPILESFAQGAGVLPLIGFLEGDAAGAASISIQGTIAVVNGAGTRPAYRRRGVHRALMADRLRRASEAGCRDAIVVTEPESAAQRNVERQGFAVAYGRRKWLKEPPR